MINTLGYDFKLSPVTVGPINTKIRSVTYDYDCLGMVHDEFLKKGH